MGIAVHLRHGEESTREGESMNWLGKRRIDVGNRFFQRIVDRKAMAHVAVALLMNVCLAALAQAQVAIDVTKQPVVSSKPAENAPPANDGGGLEVEGVEIEVVEIDVVEAPAAPPELVAVIEHEEGATVEAFNKGDAEALGKLFMEQGELIDENGNLYQGRDQITSVFKAFFERFPKAVLEMEVTGLRTVGDSLAIEEGVRRVTLPEQDTAAQMRYVAVRDKVGDHWPIASYREFSDDPLPSPREMLQGVSWLVGDWIDESPEGRTSISYRWDESGNFLVGDYTLHVDSLQESKSSQRIGWDPIEGVLRSWTFDSDGGFSTGEWVPTEFGWVVKSDATMPDGITGTATVTLTPKDEDHFVVRSSDRIVGGVDEPEFELTIARRPPLPGAAAGTGQALPPDGQPAVEPPKPAATTPGPAKAVEQPKPATPPPPAVKSAGAAAVPAAKPPAIPAVPLRPALPAAPRPVGR